MFWNFSSEPVSAKLDLLGLPETLNAITGYWTPQPLLRTKMRDSVISSMDRCYVIQRHLRYISTPMACNFGHSNRFIGQRKSSVRTTSTSD